jgi:DNA-binding transcriptional LysR family regulator
MRHLRLYRAVRLIHREGSIRKAAEHLAISPSALNRALQGFEDEMGVSLFDRVPGGVRLTTAGELMLALIDRHLADFDGLREMLGDLRSGQRGTMRISVGSDIAAGWVMTAIERTEVAHPSLSLEVVVADDAEALRRRDVQLAILANPPTDDDVEVVHGARVPVSAWVAPREARTTALWSLLRRRVLLPPPGTGTHTAITHHLRRRRLEAPVSSTMTASQLVARALQGIEACIVADCVAPPGLARLAEPLGTVNVCVLRLAKVPLSRAAQALVVETERAFEIGASRREDVIAAETR